jgi:hypothetical protein
MLHVYVPTPAEYLSRSVRPAVRVFIKRLPLDCSQPQNSARRKSRFRRSPTGTLSNEIQSFPDPAGDPLTRLIGVPPQSPAAKYAYLLGDEVKIILPVKGQYLTIPTDANLQGSGTPRYKTPRDIELQAMGGHFRRLAGKLFFGIEEAGQRFVAFFALVKKSVVRGRNILRPAIDGAAPQMTAILQERVDELLSQGAA